MTWVCNGPEPFEHLLKRAIQGSFLSSLVKIQPVVLLTTHDRHRSSDHSSPLVKVETSLKPLAVIRESFFFIYFKGKPLRMRPLPPSPHTRRRGTVINDRGRVTEVTASVRFTLRRGRFDSSSWFTVPSVLPDVLAIHTIEMIPKSMILRLKKNF